MTSDTIIYIYTVNTELFAYIQGLARKCSRNERLILVCLIGLKSIQSDINSNKVVFTDSEPSITNIARRLIYGIGNTLHIAEIENLIRNNYQLTLIPFLSPYEIAALGESSLEGIRYRRLLHCMSEIIPSTQFEKRLLERNGIKCSSVLNQTNMLMDKERDDFYRYQMLHEETVSKAAVDHSLCSNQYKTSIVVFSSSSICMEWIKTLRVPKEELLQIIIPDPQWHSTKGIFSQIEKPLAIFHFPFSTISGFSAILNCLKSEWIVWCAINSIPQSDILHEIEYLRNTGNYDLLAFFDNGSNSPFTAEVGSRESFSNLEKQTISVLVIKTSTLNRIGGINFAYRRPSNLFYLDIVRRCYLSGAKIASCNNSDSFHLYRQSAMSAPDIDRIIYRNLDLCAINCAGRALPLFYERINHVRKCGRDLSTFSSVADYNVNIFEGNHAIPPYTRRFSDRYLRMINYDPFASMPRTLSEAERFYSSKLYSEAIRFKSLFPSDNTYVFDE